MAEELCYGEPEIDWETEEGHSYVRSFWCPECQATNYDEEGFPVPHVKGTIKAPSSIADPGDYEVGEVPHGDWPQKRWPG